MSEANGVIERYIAVWNETDSDKRRDLITQTWSTQASYIDPMFEADGPDGIDVMVAGFQQQFPGHRFRLSSDVDQHHDRLRFTWELVEPAGGMAVVRGSDFGVVAPDGRLLSVTGFIDQLAESLAAG